MEQTPPLAPPEQGGRHDHHGRHGRHEDLSRHGAGRVITYFIILVIINVLLAIYALYMLGYALEFNWSILKAGSLQVILESALQLLLLFSPMILTIIVNRLLYRAFRGWKHFPHGVWFFALLVIIAVQIGTIMAIFSYGYVDGVNGLNIESIGVLPKS